MFLARVLADGEGDLVCDFAETYRLLDWRSLGARQAATLAAGLPLGSRVMTRLSGAAVPLPLQLQARIADDLALLVWMQSKDAQAGRNRPVSILQVLTAPVQEKKNDLQAYDTPEAFWAARSEFVKGGEPRG